jgi:hypothetical protein
MSYASRRTWFSVIAIVVIVVGIVGAIIGYQRGFREYPQPDWVTATPEMRFKYGSIGAEHDAGVPYWIFYVLPRIFPEKLTQDGKVIPGGYAALGVPWEQGQELPVGFTKKTIGFPRVANNCAVCHTTSYRVSADANPVSSSVAPAHTTNVEGFFRYLIDCAKDPRFNADILMAEINRVTELDLIDKLLYRFLIIPITKKRLLEREAQFAWIYRPDFPDWGRGRDDAMNLTKYFMIRAPMDDTFGPTDMPSLWNIKKYRLGAGPPHELRRRQPRRLLGDHGLGTRPARRRPANREDFVGQVKWLHGYLAQLPAPKYPFPIDAARADSGKPLFVATAPRCHASELTGRPLPLAEVGTDRGRLDSWNKGAAIKANQVVKEMGLERRGLVEEEPAGLYRSLPRRHLAQGALPAQRLGADAARPARTRSQAPDRSSGVATTSTTRSRSALSATPRRRSASAPGSTRSSKGGGNQGHEFGSQLSASEKEALVEYLKTL